MEVKLSQGLFGNRRRTTERKGRIEEMLENKASSIKSSLAPYKSSPSCHPEMGKERPVAIACKSCIASSGILLSEANKQLGIQNCFQVENIITIQARRVRLMPQFLHFWRLGENLCSDIPFLDPLEVMTDPVFQQFENTKYGSDESNGDLSEVNRKTLLIERGRAEQFLKAFGSPVFGDFMMGLIRRFGWWLLGKFLAFVFQAICIHKGEISLLREIHTKRLPVVYLPLNRSNFDSLILSWTLVNFGLPAPLFVGSHNLMQKSRMRYLAKAFGGLGCMQNRASSRIFYNYPIIGASIYSYLAALFKRGNGIQFVMEPTRSRTGTPNCQIVGVELMNAVVDLCNKHVVEDVYIVPLCINYEVAPDENILLGRKRSFFNNLLRLFRRKLGFVRITISQPFRFREFQNGFTNPLVSKWKFRSQYYDWDMPISNGPTSEHLTGGDIHWDSDRESCASVSSIYGETDLAPPQDKSAEEIPYPVKGKSQAELVEALTQHCIYDALNCSALMSTQMLSFLLINQFSKGVQLEELVREMNELTTNLRGRKRDIGVSGNMKEVVLRAVDILGPGLVIIKKETERTMIRPVMTEESLTGLRFYANHVTQIMALEAVVATAMLSVVGQSYHQLVGTGAKQPLEEEELVKVACEICQLLKGNFVFFPKCSSTEEFIRKTMEYMKNEELIGYFVKKVWREADGGEMSYAHESIYTEERLEIQLTRSCYQRLQFLRNLIRPLLQYYAFIFQALKCLIPKDKYNGEMDEVKLRGVILSELEKQFEAGLLTREGWNLKKIVRCALSNMISTQILGCYRPPNLTRTASYNFYLEEEYDTAIELDKLSATVLAYCTY